MCQRKITDSGFDTSSHYTCQLNKNYGIILLYTRDCDGPCTANTIILNNGKIVVDEPSVVALDRRTDKMIAVGERAKMMYEKENPNIRTVRPLRDGVIADFNACEQMMRGLIKKVNMGNRFFSPSLRMVIGVPSGSTEVELRAVRDSAEHAGGRDVYLNF